MTSAKEPKSEATHDLSAQALVDLPIFPLPGVVLFPRALLPLHVFEPRYRAMLARCLESHRAIAVALIPDPEDKDDQGQPRFVRVAGVGVIIEHQALPDGRANILLQGKARVELDELPGVDTPFRRARATLREDVHAHVSIADRAALVAAATSFTSELHKREALSFAIPPGAAVDAIADLCAHHLVSSAASRQSILEERDVGARVRMVIAELALQHRALLGEKGATLH